MPWHQSFSTNLAEQDAQHQYFIVLLDQLDVACQSDEELAIERLLAELERYATYHFACEELLMSAYDYPAEAHRQEHRKLLSQLNQFRSQSNYSRAKIRMFVFKWLVNHIQVVDRDLAKFILNTRETYLSEIGVGGAGEPATRLLTATAKE